MLLCSQGPNCVCVRVRVRVRVCVCVCLTCERAALGVELGGHAHAGA